MLKKMSSAVDLSDEIHRNLNKIRKLLEENSKLIEKSDLPPNRKISSILRDHKVLLSIVSQVKKIRYDNPEATDLPKVTPKKIARREK